MNFVYCESQCRIHFIAAIIAIILCFKRIKKAHVLVIPNSSGSDQFSTKNLLHPVEGDPYVKLYLLCRGKRLVKRKSHIKKRTLNPVYNEAFTFDLPVNIDISEIGVEFSILEWDRMTKNETLGRVVLGTKEIVLQTGDERHWLEVIRNPRKQIAEWHRLA
ncbi:unnamed protein product [Protopolystoma xenopodis]|uniref:C2 domain-containing protein n=1 Tax=Protopolystoma xenopodis TaxID=117903 RepID=A0A448WF00_9PLAT|nr:unnamed protein product [Protopolystoma xenopodis]